MKAELKENQLLVDALKITQPTCEVNTSCNLEYETQTSVTNNNHDLKKKIDELEVLLNAQKDENLNLKTTNDNLNEKIKANFEEKFQIKAEMNQIQTENDELSMQIVDNAEENDTLKRQLEKMNEIVQDHMHSAEKMQFIEQITEHIDEKVVNNFFCYKHH